MKDGVCTGSGRKEEGRRECGRVVEGGRKEGRSVYE